MRERLCLNPQRNSSIEVLRCIAMFFVIMSHSSAHGNFSDYDSVFSLNGCIVDWVKLGNLGTDIFVMLSGWNLYGKKLKIHTVINFIVQVWSISVFGLIIFGLTGASVSIKSFMIALFPITFDNWWFATAYLVLLILSPSINVFVENTDRKHFDQCLLAMIILWCIIPTISIQDMYGDRIIQMIMLYLIGAYLRKYPDNFLSKKKNAQYTILLTMTLMFMSSVTIRFIDAKLISLPLKTTMFYERSSVFVIGCSSAMVSLAVYAHNFHNKWINTSGACTFGIYLLHEHPLIKELLWTRWLDNAQYFGSDLFFVRMMLSVVAVFGICFVIEWGRILFLSKPMNQFAEKLLTTIFLLFKKIVQRITIQLQNSERS